MNGTMRRAARPESATAGGHEIDHRAGPAPGSGRGTRWRPAGILAGVIALAVAAPLAAAPKLAGLPDPNPELERRSFQVAEGFEVNLFAADPMIAKPLQMNFDAAGRLWLVSSETYPQVRPGQAANDKVIVLEDRDGDGRADTATVFADGLLIPTGIEPGDGGAYVANSTELLHLKDTDGDGRADQRRVMLSGFGTEDTHHLLHTLRWGPDGMLYFNQSIYIHSHVETPYGVRRLGGGGIWQFRPETMELDVFIRGLCNPWGHCFDRWGQSFATDGAGSEGINFLVPGATFTSYYAADPSRYLKGLNPGSPKYCGAEILSGRHLPEDWRGNLLTNDFRGNRVCRFVLCEDGAGYAAREQGELIKTSDIAFRPVDVKMGPDGAIYIADWYNPIINHGEVDFRDPRRDHIHGRIWRVTAKGRPLVKRPRLADASTEALLEALKAPEDWTRQHAKRVLKERGRAVLPALAAWVRRLDPADPDVEHHQLEALWTYQSLDVVEPALLARLARAPDDRVRAAATRVIGAWHSRLSDPLALLAVQVADDHPRVRLEAVRALGRIPQARSAELAMRALDRPVDRFLDYALWLTARELEPSWLPAVRSGRFAFGDPRHLVFALEAAGSPATVQPLMDLLQAGKVPKAEEEKALTLVGALGEPPQLARIFDLAVAGPSAPAGRRAGLLAALMTATRQRKVRPAADLARLGCLLAVPDEALRGVAARAAGLWQVESLRPRLLDLARAPDTSDRLRQAAIDALVLLGGRASREALEQLSGVGRPLGVRMMAVVALAALDRKAGAARAVDVLADDHTADDPTAVFAGFLEHQDGPAALAAALAGRKVPADVAKIGVRMAGAAGRPEPALVEALNRAGGLSAGREPLTPRQIEQMVAEVRRRGDPRRGEAIFRRKEQTCLKCHAIAGAGGQVGPDLVSIGASAPVDYLIDSVLEPNKAVKENYQSLVIATDDGRVITGIKVRQTDAELVLRDAEGHDVAVPVSSIADQKPGGSLMPTGLADSLTRGEFIDLIRFLSELGKLGPYAAGTARVVRRWQVLEPTAAAISELRHTSFDAAASGDPRFTWSPAYSQVSGTLPLDAVPAIKPGDGLPALGFARCQLDVSTPGRVMLRLNSAAGVTVWIDGIGTRAGAAMVVNLAAGVHTVTLAIDLDRRRDGLRCELDDAPGSAARAQIVGGK